VETAIRQVFVLLLVPPILRQLSLGARKNLRVLQILADADLVKLDALYRQNRGQGQGK
jgi:hypothetical protein